MVTVLFAEIPHRISAQNFRDHEKVPRGAERARLAGMNGVAGGGAAQGWRDGRRNDARARGEDEREGHGNPGPCGG